MILIDNIERLLIEGVCNHIRIYDRTMQNHLLDLDADTPENLYIKLKLNAEILSGYGILTIKAGDDTCHKRSMTGASVWKVFFNNSTAANNQNVVTPVNTGYSKEYLETTIQLQTLKLQMEFDKKERELEKKFAGGDEEKYFKYAPLLGSLFGITDEQMMKKLQMCQLAGGLSGIPQTQSNQTRLTVEGTDDEKVKIVERLVPEIFNKVDKNKFIAVLQGLNDNPEFIESAYAYMSLTNGTKTGLSGQNIVSENETNISNDNIYLGYISINNDEFF